MSFLVIWVEGDGTNDGKVIKGTKMSLKFRKGLDLCYMGKGTLSKGINSKVIEMLYLGKWMGEYGELEMYAEWWKDSKRKHWSKMSLTILWEKKIKENSEEFILHLHLYIFWSRWI